ncbi:MAG TPA: RNA polymerase sigma factor [Bacteroidales bacterium]|nr:RNA polymerase sigma factor [Bacteroidales bacterium]
MNDEQLIARVIEGDNDAFRELIEKYQQLVHKTCFNILRQEEDAEDVVQEVFIESFESIRLFRKESKFSTWLYRIAINKSLNHKRKHKWKNVVSSIENFFGGDNPRFEIVDHNANNSPETIDYNERARILQQAIQSLPENQRIAFTLCKYDELSYQEISEIMNLSFSSVESLIHRAKMNLQKRLINYYKN